MERKPAPLASRTAGIVNSRTNADSLVGLFLYDRTRHPTLADVIAAVAAKANKYPASAAIDGRDLDVTRQRGNQPGGWRRSRTHICGRSGDDPTCLDRRHGCRSRRFGFNRLLFLGE